MPKYWVNVVMSGFRVPPTSNPLWTTTLVMGQACARRYVGLVTAQLETVIECLDVDAMVEFFTSELGCRLELVTPADDPREFVVATDGARLRLVRSSRDVPARLRFVRSGAARQGLSVPASVTAPNGTTVEFVASAESMVIPENQPTLSVVRVGDEDVFGAGRAGMGYRDLLPDRWGGRFIASHIRIADGGDVADYVHFHRIRFQMIFVVAGWVEVVYEDQGAPFRMVAGDCVLQPPEIRHRVLRSSPGLEVIEVGCPAEHDTLVEHRIDLPTLMTRPERTFSGQRFVRHIAATATWTPCSTPGFDERDTGISDATDGLADVRVLARRADNSAEPAVMHHLGEFAMVVLLAGAASLRIEYDGAHRTEALGVSDAVALPPGCRWSWVDCTDDLEVLHVVLPAGCIEPVEGAIHAA